MSLLGCIPEYMCVYIKPQYLVHSYVKGNKMSRLQFIRMEHFPRSTQCHVYVTARAGVKLLNGRGATVIYTAHTVNATM